MKSLLLNSKTQKHVKQICNENRSDTNCWNHYMRSGRKCKLTDLLHTQKLTCTNLSFRIEEQECVPWSGEFQNFEERKHLGILSIFTPIPLTPKMCGLSISSKGRM